jgi:hypothetical protein
MNMRTLAIICSLLVLLFVTSTANQVTAQRPSGSGQVPGNVSITFDGMEALFFGQEGRVTVGMLDAHHHTPVITVTQIANNQRTVIAELRGKQLSGLLSIDAEGVGATGVQRWQANDMKADANDARWMIDFNELYPGKTLTIKEELLSAKIQINVGMFHADKLSAAPVKFFSSNESGKTLSFNRKVGYPAAKVNLSEGDKLTISGRNFAPVRLIGAKGTQYQIAINNLPPRNMMSMDHFLNYYDIINEALPRYVPVYAIKASFDPYPAMCAPVAFGR